MAAVAPRRVGTMVPRRPTLVGFIALVIGAMLSATPRPAEAAVTACTATTDSFAFGSISLTSASSLTGTVRIHCTTQFVAVTLTVSVRYCLNIGSGTGGAEPLMTPRWMQAANGERLGLQLSHDAAHATPLGALYAPSTPPLTGAFTYLSILGLIGSGSATHTIHARVPAQPSAAVGSYQSDFGGEYTELVYRYADVLLAPAPTSCTTGGTGGATVARGAFSASATVEPECHLVGASDLDFGDVPGVIATPVSATSTIQMTCRRGTAWQMSLGDGLHPSGATRRMAGPGGSLLRYDLYRDAAMSQRFGQTENVDRLVGTGNGTTQTVTVHGRIPGGQSVGPGAYSDRVIVTVTY